MRLEYYEIADSPPKPHDSTSGGSGQATRYGGWRPGLPGATPTPSGGAFRPDFL